MVKEYGLNDKVIMKKPHACQSNLWVIIRCGVDIKLRCVKCQHEIMLDRLVFERKLKKIVRDEK